MRNAVLEEDRVKLQNQVSRLTRQAPAGASPAAAGGAGGEEPPQMMDGLKAMLGINDKITRNPTASPGMRARRGSV